MIVGRIENEHLFRGGVGIFLGHPAVQFGDKFRPKEVEAEGSIPGEKGLSARFQSCISREGLW
jgi:hypothetical protein